MKFEIPYGKTKIDISIPHSDHGEVIKDAVKVKEKTDETNIIKDSLLNPISSPILSEMAKEKTSAVILASDITRPCPSYKFLPFLIDELKEGGIYLITVILGLGIHRKHTFEEKIKLAGAYALENAAIIDSDPERCISIGTTSRGTPVEVFEEALKADLLIATGNIEYHYFAGYSGGAKAVMPGICSKRSIQSNHSHMLDDSSLAGRFYGNPVRKDIEEAGKMAGIDFIFNVILDNDKKVIAAVSGKNSDAYIEGIKIYDSIYKKETDKKADIVITSPGGYPKDINLYQAQKALENIKEIVKKNGKIIFVAQCPEGFGEDIFKEWMKDCKDYALLSTKIKEDFILGGHKAVAISKILSQNQIYLYSDFDRETTDSMGFKKIDDLTDFINKEIDKNKDLKITIVPNGRLVKYKIKERIPCPGP